MVPVPAVAVKFCVFFLIPDCVIALKAADEGGVGVVFSLSVQLAKMIVAKAISPMFFKFDFIISNF